MKITRGQFISGFTALFFGKMAKPQLARKKFYITGLSHTAMANDCTIPPIVANGISRLDALAQYCMNRGITVWTQEEWEDFQTKEGKEFDKRCADLNKGGK